MICRAWSPSRLQVEAADADRAGGREEQAAHQLEGGRLAGAVGAEEGEQLAGLDVQAQAVHRRLGAVVLGDVVELDHLRLGYSGPGGPR